MTYVRKSIAAFHSNETAQVISIELGDLNLIYVCIKCV